MPQPLDSSQPLDATLNLISSNDAAENADAGIAGRGAKVLGEIEYHAHSLRDAAGARAMNLIKVALEGLERGLSEPSLRLLAVQVDFALRESMRWSELAGNANYYRHHREMALRVAEAIRAACDPGRDDE